MADFSEFGESWVSRLGEWGGVFWEKFGVELALAASFRKHLVDDCMKPILNGCGNSRPVSG